MHIYSVCACVFKCGIPMQCWAMREKCFAYLLSSVGNRKYCHPASQKPLMALDQGRSGGQEEH